MSQNEHCKGCATFNLIDDPNLQVDCPDSNYEGNCPCTECVVKVMCLLECDDYKIWTTNNVGSKRRAIANELS